MQHLIALPKRPQSAANANQNRDITIAVEACEVMVERTKGVMDFLGLNSIRLNVVPNTAIPDGMPRGFFPHPQSLLAAMGKKLSPSEYSAVCLKLLDQYGDTMSNYLRGRLQSGLVKPDPTNLKGWSPRVVPQNEGELNVYELGFSPITRFQTGDMVYNLPARDGRKPLVAAGAIPGALLEWVIAFALFQDLKSEIKRVDPWVVHPGTRVRDDVHDWSSVSRCIGWYGRAYCYGDWDDDVGSDVALFSLL